MKLLSLIVLALSFCAIEQASAAALVRSEVRCESKGLRSETCHFSNWGRVEFSRQLSNAPCIFGSTVFLDRPGQVTVTDGCRAAFIADVEKDAVSENDQVIDVVGNRSFTMRCESNDQRYETCRIPWYRVSNVYLERQHSSNGSPCIQGMSYQINRDLIQVWNGCRATFRIQAW